jgi:hypothetical protein
MVFEKIANSFAATIFIALGLSSNAEAAVFNFTKSEEFFNSLNDASRQTETFEGLATNTVISSGTTLNGITYESFNGVDAGRIDSNFNRFGNNSLASERDGNLDTIDFFDRGESVTISFDRPIYAIGIFFNALPSPDNAFYINTPVGKSTTGGDGSKYDVDNFFFAGLVSDTPFTTATFGAENFGGAYNVDNLTYADEPVPEPATILGGLMATVAIAAKRRRQRRR